MEKGIAKNIELIGYHDLEERPGFQMAMQEVDGRYYLYVAPYTHQGMTVMEVTDPENPRFVRWIPDRGGKPGTATFKVQVADGIMITQLQLKLSFLRDKKPDAPCDDGFYVWDVKDPEDPKRLGHWKTGGGHWIGTHRNYYDGGRYVHCSATAPGFVGHIYRIVDIEDPTNPVEASKWWLPEQWIAGGAKYTGPNYPEFAHPSLQLHGPYPRGDRSYLAYCDGGFAILDISDITKPKLVGQLKTKPPLGAFISLHSVVPYATKPYIIVSSEGTGRAKQPLSWSGILDISDETNPTLISMFPIPEPPPGASYKNFHEKSGWFGPHNWHEPHGHPALEDRDDRAYNAYFTAGLRVYDINDPLLPKEIAYYLQPEPTKWMTRGRFCAGALSAEAEDVLVDNRGNIFMTDSNNGLFVLRCTV